MPETEREPNRLIEKHAPLLHAKALTSDDQPGTFEAVWALFGNEDSDGEVVEPGAFTDSWARKLPKVIYSHDWCSVPIGVTLAAEEYTAAQLGDLLPGGVPDGVTGGAWSKARLLVDTANGEDHEEARAVYAALKATGGDGRPALDEFSWGGRVLSETIEQRDGTYPLWHINQVDQAEWGPCVRGANPATALVAVKSMIAAGQVTREQAREALELALDETRKTEAADAEKNILSSDDLVALRAVLGLPADTPTADTLEALRVYSPPVQNPLTVEQMRRIADVALA